MDTSKFINKLKNDSQLAVELANVCSLDEAYQVAQKNGVTDDKDTFCQTMKEFRDEISKITEEDMGNLVGSSTTSEIVSAISTWTGAAAAAGAAAV